MDEQREEEQSVSCVLSSIRLEAEEFELDSFRHVLAFLCVCRPT